jgi:hypothetical protein
VSLVQDQGTCISIGGERRDVSPPVACSTGGLTPRRSPTIRAIMAYTDFTLETLESVLGITARPADLFPSLAPLPVPVWLQEMLTRGLRQPLLSEKARGEFIIGPILLATQELSSRELAIYSGQRLDVDPAQGLVGECDFILAATPTLPALRAPVMTLVEAKKTDIESGIAQCMAQMFGARLFNERAGLSSAEMYGCVTSGEAWQFLRLKGAVAAIDRSRYYIDNVGAILAVLQAIVSRPGVPAGHETAAVT